MKRGFTLIELMIVVVIIGVLATAAIPLYNHYINEAARSEANTILPDIAAKEEASFADWKRYLGTPPLGALPDAGTRTAQVEVAGGPRSQLGYKNVDTALFAGPPYHHYPPAAPAAPNQNSYTIFARRSISAGKTLEARLTSANRNVVVHFECNSGTCNVAN